MLAPIDHQNFMDGVNPLDSDFIIRKISGKGHTIFLKDVDIAQYFFSKSSKHIGKVSNSSGLLRFSTPELAMRIAEMF